MPERPLPEAIRGSWYFLPESTDPKNPGDKAILVYQFRLDGSFSAFTLKKEKWSEKDSGDYTFDGAFLIIRGRNTDTFRVRVETFWRWHLEEKKKDYVLLRNLITEDDFVELDPAVAKRIRLAPTRVTVQKSGDSEEAIQNLVYTAGDEDILVGSAFIERNDQDIWIGLTPVVSGLEKKTWEGIIRESFLDVHLDEPDDVRVVTIRFFDDNESVVFNYTVA